MRAIEIRIRAERRCGELLVEMKRAQGKRSDLATSGQADAKSFSEQREAYGISEPQARRWQKLAAVPEAEFEATFARPEKPSTTGIVNRGKKRNVVDPRALGSGAGCSTSRGMACAVPIPRKSVRPYLRQRLPQAPPPADIAGIRTARATRLSGPLLRAIDWKRRKRTRRRAGGAGLSDRPRLLSPTLPDGSEASLTVPPGEWMRRQ